MLYLLGAVLFGIAYGFPCCVVHDTMQSCAAEGSGTCVWLGDTHQLFTSGASMNAKCVSDPWFQCEMGVYCPPAPVAPPPVVAGATSCYLTPCANLAVDYNVAFVIDESGSVGATNYIKSLNFVGNMVNNNVADNAKIAMIAFASGTDRIYHFQDSQHDQRAGANAALAAEKNDYNGGMTYMANALQMIIEEFRTSPAVSTSDNNILFLLTDGKPNGGDVCAKKAALDAAGVQTWVLGVGSGFSTSAVRCLVDLDPRIMNIANFDEEEFYKMESKLRATVCPVVFDESIFARANNLMYDYGMDTGSVSFWVIFSAFIIGMLAYWNKERLCNKSGKYQPIIDDEPCYGSTNTV